MTGFFLFCLGFVVGVMATAWCVSMAWFDRDNRTWRRVGAK